MQKIKVTLLGAAGERQIEIKAKPAPFTRHIKAPREIPGTPPPKPAPPATSKTTPATLLEVIRFMHASANHADWLIFDEILYVTRAQYKMKFTYETLLDALREEFKQGHLEHKLNRFDQHTFRLIESD